AFFPVPSGTGPAGIFAAPGRSYFVVTLTRFNRGGGAQRPARRPATQVSINGTTAALALPAKKAPARFMCVAPSITASRSQCPAGSASNADARPGDHQDRRADGGARIGCKDGIRTGRRQRDVGVETTIRFQPDLVAR